MYDTVCRVLELKDKLNKVCSALELPKLKTTDVDFLTEYRRVLQPLASTLNALQGQTDCFCGMILPKLIQLRHSITQLKKTNLVYCDPLASALLNGLQTRYGSLLELEMLLAKDASIAAISHPQFKLRWVPPAQRELLRATFVECLNVESSSVTDDVAVPAVSDDEDYGTMKLQQVPFSVVLLKQKLHPIWLIQTVLLECYTSIRW